MTFTTVGIEEMRKRLEALRAAAPTAARAAAVAGAQVVYDRSQDTVPVDTGALQASGAMLTPEDDGRQVTSGVQYGNDETLTDWNGMGYEIFVELGTDHHTYVIPPNPFLATATTEATPQLLDAQGAAWNAHMQEVGL